MPHAMQGILQGVLIGLGVVAVGAGLWLVRSRRHDPRHEAPGHRAGLAQPTTMVLGFSCLVAGYHLLAYGLPAGWLTIRVGVDRLWILGLGIGIAAGASVVLDRIERQQDERSGGPVQPPGDQQALRAADDQPPEA